MKSGYLLMGLEATFAWIRGTHSLYIMKRCKRKHHNIHSYVNNFDHNANGTLPESFIDADANLTIHSPTSLTKANVNGVIR